MNTLFSAWLRKLHGGPWPQGASPVSRMARAVAPFLAIVLTGVVFFHQAMVESVQNSPHPQLVYIMLAVFVVATLTQVWNLQRSVQDAVLAEWWRDATPEQRQGWSEQPSGASLFAPVLRLLGGSPEAPALSAGRLDGEIFAVRQRMGERAALPDFLGSAMIGLGLVGTFIGLLSVLQDLAGLFSVMSGPQAATRDSASVFGELVQKLQEPMRGMGTAFLASLYGLAGSLLLGVLTQSVKHAGHQALATLRQIVQAHSPAAGDAVQAGPAGEGAAAAADARKAQATQAAQAAQIAAQELQQWQAMFSAMRQEHQAFVASAAQAMQEISRHMGHMPQLVQALQQRTAIDAQVQHLLGQGAHWHDAWEQMSEQMQQLRTQNASHAQALEQAMALQAALAQQQLQLGREQALATQQSQALRDAQWQSALAQQQQAFEQTSARLRSLTAALLDRAEQPPQTRTDAAPSTESPTA